MTADDLRTSDNDLMVTMRAALQDLIDKRSIRDRDALLTQLVTAAVALIPAATGGGILRTEELEVRSSHATAPAVHELDQFQSELGEGPCVEAADEPPENGVLLARDLAGEDAARWPRFAPRAVEAGFRSILSASVTGSTGGRRAALTLYAADADAFDEHAVVTAGVFAGHAGALLYGADHAQLLGAALDSRDTIGQAKGILMERFALDGEEAFALLVSSSQDTNMKLADVARWVVKEACERRAQRG
ncbi:GAF and ANTAR domain-containing protein [Actinomycetospora lemnae]|uniref:GAF and ANTAR domain-containing protein n=1 Tax=Actinomycetospora lemnae TaxID=3019891 RepID=A0ABT5SR81_9PSEU|nr:GAF and ANTAR domain-containing protein [Actinomycetospora sp. DW7H6]MDD7965350.1 GAF and ANTAR domain-containing protein [Actinomycetospora sp. DW7H6]